MTLQVSSDEKEEPPSGGIRSVAEEMSDTEKGELLGEEEIANGIMPSTAEEE